jgi:hypothetical protein
MAWQQMLKTSTAISLILRHPNLGTKAHAHWLLLWAKARVILWS